MTGLPTGHPATSQGQTVRRLRAAGCVFAEDEAALLHSHATGDVLARLVARRAAGEPLEHVLGEVEFDGLRLAVGPGVFVPRQRTALLAHLAAARCRPGAVLVDLCCGCGAVAAAVSTRVPGLTVHAADHDPVALRYARRNLPGATVHLGDLDEALPDQLRGRVDVLTANTPYVPSDALRTMPPEARDHEPTAALDGGPDGLCLARRVVASAPGWLAPGGAVLIETSQAQGPVLSAAMAAHQLDASVVHDDELGATVVVGVRR